MQTLTRNDFTWHDMNCIDHKGIARQLLNFSVIWDMYPWSTESYRIFTERQPKGRHNSGGMCSSLCLLLLQTLLLSQTRSQQEAGTVGRLSAHDSYQGPLFKIRILFLLVTNTKVASTKDWFINKLPGHGLTGDILAGLFLWHSLNVD